MKSGNKDKEIKGNIIRSGVKGFVKKYSNKGRTLEIGCGYSHYAEYFPNRVCIDIVKLPAVDIVADAHDLNMLKSAEFDCVLCTEVLEHLHTPEKAVNEMWRVLKKEGMLILTTRFMFPLHDVPVDYYRFTEYGLKYLLKDFDIIEMEKEADTIGTLSAILKRIGFQTKIRCPKFLSRIAGWFWVRFWVLLSRLVQPLSFLIGEEYCQEIDKLVKLDNIMTTGYYIACRKK